MSFISSLTGKEDSGLEKKKVSELIPYDRNPNTHPEAQIEQLANSIRQWGWTMPILIDENGMVIAGHGRLYAAQKLEMEEVPCISVLGWTDEQKKAYVIADNKLAEGSQWDDSLYFSELESLSKAGFKVELTGFESMNFSSEENFDFSDDNYEPSNDADEFNQTIIQYVMIFDDKSQQNLWHDFLATIKSKYGAEGTHSSRVYRYLKSTGF